MQPITNTFTGSEIKNPPQNNKDKKYNYYVGHLKKWNLYNAVFG
jgi:hypothetical protein